jgi:hypothetical protein
VSANGSANSFILFHSSCRKPRWIPN